VLADPDARGASNYLRIEGGFGLLLDGRRAVARGGDLHLAPDVAEAPLQRFFALPKRFGGGFLWASRGALFRSTAFDGPLTPLAGEEMIQRVSFGPNALLVRDDAGYRALIDPTTGKALPMRPTGLVDIAALDDGRAVALVEGGHALVSTDRGATWTEVTSRLAAPPTDVDTEGDAVYLIDRNFAAYRLEQNGALTEFRAVPRAPVKKAFEKDPRYRSDVPPLRLAARIGARVDDHAAVLVVAGDLVRIELPTGRIVDVRPGVLPPDMPCEAARAGEDIVFVCGKSGKGVVVASGAVEGEVRIERSFSAVGPFFMGDDGTLVLGAPCAPTTAARAACIRSPRGTWAEYALPCNDDADAGAPCKDEKPVRWIPRPAGAPRVISASPFEFIDVATGKPEPIHLERLPSDQRSLLERALAVRTSGAATLLDRGFSADGDGTVHAWLEGGRAVTIDDEGNVTVSAFSFSKAQTAGQFALADAGSGRAFLTRDRGATWNEIAPPPGGLGEMRGCSEVGCDLGAFVRIGYQDQPPMPSAPPRTTPTPPARPHVPVPALTCTPLAAERLLVSQVPDEFSMNRSLGQRTVPATGALPNGDPIVYAQRFLGRDLQHPLYPGSTDERTPRLVLHGHEFTVESGLDPAGAGGASDPLRGVVVQGPQKSASAAVQNLLFVEPFETTGAIRSGVYRLSNLAALARKAEMSLDFVLATGWPTPEVAFPILHVDPKAPTELLLELNEGDLELIGVARGGSSPRFDLRWGMSRAGTPISAVALDKDRYAILFVNEDGSLIVHRADASGITPAHSIPAPPQASFYPTNPDALAVDDKGELFVLRTPSGALPPTEDDPALLLPLGNGLPVALAPWSTLRPASDPACTADRGGVRAVVRMSGVPGATWIELRTAVVPDASLAAVAARVRWSKTRVCLEAIEVPERSRTVGFTDVETEIVAVFDDAPRAGRVAVERGVELSQPMSCTLSGP
jgi:hypothetical protein